MTGYAKEPWGQLADDDFDVVAGRRDQLAGKIQEPCGLAKTILQRTGVHPMKSRPSRLLLATTIARATEGASSVKNERMIKP